ncbi:hypothetical protein [Ulvibacter antarcticus]|uniref:NIPSNAP protein n=1 Tax=Ulvibacter antarcticus TaxID=442714 RepID=A0A3L9ZI72_9FLAO|nr:hypothetical protein [Ulvibacter antarcticus]RMA66412.1 hypothetical protein BXY75_0836 [Ulvibacter antarcticus]
MKTKHTPIGVLIIFLLLVNTAIVNAQEKPVIPAYVAVTTMHWNMEMEDFDMDKWKATEKEYLDKVTMKNEHVLSSSFYLHYFTADNSEVIYVRTYPSWDAIDKAVTRNEELEKLAWPNESARDAYFKKQGAYYSNEHSDEIYAPIPGAKLLPQGSKEDYITYVRKSHFAFPEDGSREDFMALRTEGNEKIIQKNEFIRAYYPNVHAWGSDRTEFMEAFYVDTLADLDKMLDRQGTLAEEAWPNETARTARNKKVSKYFTGIHGDFIYRRIGVLSK